MHTAQLVCTQDSHVLSDIMSASSIAEAKGLAKQNYQTKYNNNPNWKKKWPTFDALLTVSTYKTA